MRQRALYTASRAARTLLAPSSLVQQSSGACVHQHARRHAFSNLPEATVYGGPSSAPAKRVTVRSVATKYTRGEVITMVTAYDFPSAVHVRACVRAVSFNICTWLLLTRFTPL